MIKRKTTQFSTACVFTHVIDWTTRVHNLTKCPATVLFFLHRPRAYFINTNFEDFSDTPSEIIMARDANSALKQECNSFIITTHK
jgi:hypothetical protein